MAPLSEPALADSTRVESIWDKALALITDEDLKLYLKTAVRMQKRDILPAVLEAVNERQQECLRKRWILKSDGNQIIVRDLLEKVADSARRFNERGNMTVQSDSINASFPWAAIRFLLRAAVGSVQEFANRCTQLDVIARLISRCHGFESQYLEQRSLPANEIAAEALTHLYAGILTHLGRMVSDFKGNPLVPAIKSESRVEEDAEFTEKILGQTNDMLRLASWTDAQIFDFPEPDFIRLSDQTVESWYSLSEEEHTKMLDWLSPLKCHEHHQFISDYRMPGFGQWLLNDPRYKSWHTSNYSSILSLQGILGCGKTTLCSVVVDDLITTTTKYPTAAPFSYIYCSSEEFERGRSSSNDVMRTILSQLAFGRAEQSRVYNSLWSDFERRSALARVNEVDVDKLTSDDCVRLILEIAEQEPLTVVIDGLDHIKGEGNRAIIDALANIVMNSENVVKVLLSTKDNHHHLSVLSPNETINVTAQEVRSDMETFVNHQLDTALAAGWVDGRVWPTLRGVLRQALLDNAGESFISAQLQIRRLTSERTEEGIMFALRNNVAADLNSMYEHVLKGILEETGPDRTTTITTFSLLLYMRESLTPSAFLSAVATTSDITLTLPQLMEMCSGLIVLDPKCNTLRFLHSSFKEYLVNIDLFSPISGHRLLTELCLEVCSRGPPVDYEMSSAKDSIYAYAAANWLVHFKAVQDEQLEDALCKLVLAFLFDEGFNITSSFGIWLDNIQLLVKHFPNGHVLKEAVGGVPNTREALLFIVSAFGLDKILEPVLQATLGVDLSCKTHQGHTPIYLAAAFGHISVILTLLNHGAEIDVQGGGHGSPLNAACFAGHTDVVGKLLEHGASPRCGTAVCNALEAAYQGGREGVALRLLQNGRVLQTAADYERAVLGAAQAGFLKVLQQLQQDIFTSVKVSEWNEDQMKAVTRKAIEGGHLNVLRWSLSVNAGRTRIFPEDAVAIAVLYGRPHLIQFLLEKGMGIETEGKFGTPLATASLLNHRALVLLLLRHGAEVDARGTTGTALYLAAVKAHTDIVQLLLQAGAKVNQKSGSNGTALRAAASHGSFATTKVLLSAGATVRVWKISEKPFLAAIDGGNPDVVALMLDHGYREFNSDHRDLCGLSGFPSKYRALLRDASPGRKNLVSRPLKYDEEPGPSLTPPANLDAIFRAEKDSSSLSDASSPEPTCSRGPMDSYRSSNSLFRSASLGNKDVVTLILGKSEALDIRDEHVTEAASIASREGHSSVLEVLIDYLAPRIPLESCIKSVIKAARGCDYEHSNVIDVALAKATQYCPTDQADQLKAKARAPSQKCRELNSMDRKELRSRFEAACEFQRLDLLKDILESTNLRQLKSSDLSDGLQLAVMKGHTTVVDILLSCEALKGMIRISQDYVIGAARNGYLDILKALVSYCQAKPSDAKRIGKHIGRALVSSCRSGHSDVVRYLVQELSADVNKVVPDMPIEEEPRRRRMERRYNYFGGRSNSSGPPSYTSPLQAAIRGFGPRCDPDEFDFLMVELDFSEIDNSDISQHEEVVKILVEHGANPNDLGAHEIFPIQAAADLCTEKAIQLLIDAGADVNSVNGEGSSIFRAAGQETSAASIVNVLLDAGANLLNDEAEVEKLHQQPLKYFAGQMSSTDFQDSMGDPDGRFRAAKSLECVFKDGPGAVIRTLMARFTQLRASDERYGLVLQMAVCLGDYSYVDMLLSRGVNVNALGHYYGTALQAASRFGHLPMATKLLEAGANVNILQGRWHTALRAAIMSCNELIVQLLLDHGADMHLAFDTDTVSRSGRKYQSPTALQLAVGAGKLEIVETLLAAGADVSGDVSGDVSEGSTRPKIGVEHHPLILSAEQGNLAIVTALLDSGAPVDVTGQMEIWRYSFNDVYASPLSAAVKAGHIDVIQLLLARGANVNKKVNDGFPALMLAAENGSRQTVQLLIQHKADVNYSVRGMSALTFAISEGYADIVQDLLAAGAKVTGMNMPNALSEACRKWANTRILELLLEVALSTDNPEPTINQAFSAVVRLEDEKRMGILLDYVPANAKRFIQGCTIGSELVVKRMLKQGMDPNQPDDQGCYPLHAAAVDLQASIIQILLNHGADVDCISKEHGTPLMAAVMACSAPRFEFSAEFMGSLERRNLGCVGSTWTVGTDFPPPPVKPQRLDRCEKIVEVLLKNDARPGNVDTSWLEQAMEASGEGPPMVGPPLHLACLTGSMAIVKQILDKGASVNETGGTFLHALFAALVTHQPDMVKFLLEHGADTKQFHQKFGTPLHIAGKLADVDSVRELLKHGADATAIDADGKLPLEVTILQMDNRRRLRQGDNKKCEHKKTLVDMLLQAGGKIPISEDLVRNAAESGELRQLLDDSDLYNNALSEQVVCAVLSSDGTISKDELHAIMERTGGLGVTEMMLKAATNSRMATILLDFQAGSKVTADVL
ncbi:ankyrin repeat-containing domain protein [Ilyonectria robusta]|uniref:ankyrin repeat-containing domain protein n=1 Tax=Ilyonectria robusta TaxID=1079257 RepID=UPI001E8E2CB6|nr:ankyrin repeat-containing domain protein [Ilyonectria robusta]KAH8736065.1 ankyrin repeat-containing domain protein [Ilyonectria robusta]